MAAADVGITSQNIGSILKDKSAEEIAKEITVLETLAASGSQPEVPAPYAALANIMRQIVSNTLKREPPSINHGQSFMVLRQIWEEISAEARQQVAQDIKFYQQRATLVHDTKTAFERMLEVIRKQPVDVRETIDTSGLLFKISQENPSERSLDQQTNNEKLSNFPDRMLLKHCRILLLKVRRQKKCTLRGMRI